jgi:alpha-glucosidase (family GH31 glycosyl hydrolase)
LPDGLLSRDGWQLLDDSGRPILIDGWATQRPGGLPTEGLPPEDVAAQEDLDWYLFAYGSNYLLAFSSLAEISGRVPLPRKHVMGSWYCRWFKYTSAQFRGIVREYHEHDFPLDILVMDMDWHEVDKARTGHGQRHEHGHNLGWTGYSWNKKLIPDPEKLLKEFRKDGIFVTLNEHPCDGVRENENCYKAFMAKLRRPQGENPPFNAGNRAYMDAFFQAALAPLEKQGVDFWWLDWQQDYIYPSVAGVPHLRHLPWLNTLYYRHSERSGRRGQSFSRWGGWGDHRHPINFSGDAGTNWEMLAFQVLFTLASGNAGCFFWAHDVGGFWGNRIPEAYARWVQFGALSAALRLHSCGDDLDRRPWLWGENLENAMREFFHLRAKLFPYVYTSARQCHDQTIPLLRPMYLAYPEREEAYIQNGQYLFGDNLLVSPIVSPGEGPAFIAKKTVWFPDGVWYNFFTGERFEGPRTVEVEAAIDEMPLHARAGAPLPTRPYTPRMATAPLDTLVVRCYPGQTGQAKLYEDDGQSRGYLNGECAWTGISYQRAGRTVTVRIEPAAGKFAGQLARRSYKVELPCTVRAESATVNGRSAKIIYDEERKINTIAAGEAPLKEAQEFVVVVDEAAPEIFARAASEKRKSGKGKK